MDCHVARTSEVSFDYPEDYLRKVGENQIWSNYIFPKFPLECSTFEQITSDRSLYWCKYQLEIPLTLS